MRKPRRHPPFAPRAVPLAQVIRQVLASPMRNLVFGGLFVFTICLLAMIGYLLAGWSFSDSLYMVVLTIYTVGYDEVRAIDTPFLRANTMMLIILGCTGMIFLTGALVQFITITQFQQLIGSRRMKQDIESLSGHVIICGFGRIGAMLAQELTAGQVPFVVLERQERRFAEARESGYLAIQADATEEVTLQVAGVARARVLASVLPDDAANVFITLSARSLNPALEIIARGEVASTERKLLQAGANRVVMPAHIGAERIAQIILFPERDRMLEDSDRMRVFQRELQGLGLKVFTHPVAAGSRAEQRPLGEIEREAAGSFFVLGIERPGRRSLERPPGETILQAGDGVVLLARDGHAEAIAQLFGAAFSTI
ncbi:potassium channel family protein [Acidisoma sp. C75]